MRRALQRGPIAWMAQHSVAANLILVFCLVGGYLSLQMIQKEVFPDITPDIVQVTMAYPGASPEEVEQGIVLAIEEAVRGIDGVDKVSSTAAESMANVRIEMVEGEDLQKLAQDVQSEIDRIITFPEDAEEPQVSVLSHKIEVLVLVLYGDLSDTVLHELGEQVRDQLLQDPNVTQVEVSGLPPLEIGIEVSQDKLREYGLTLEAIAGRLASASVELPGGGIKTQSGEILTRVKERRDYGQEFALTPIITAPNGSQVLLGDIATIRDAFADTDRRALYNDKPAIMITVYRIGNQTPTQVEAAALRELEDIRTSLPPGVDIEVTRNMADIYRQRAQLLVRNGLFGLALVLVALGLFLELRLAFWVMMGIPASFLGSLLFLPLMDVSINMISMFAYILVLGIVVDDAIVIGENIYYHHQQGKPFLEAAIVGARELATPVTFSILTNIAAFTPLLFVPGVMGRIFKCIPIVVTIVFLISLLESIFVLPAHLGHHRERQRRGLNRRLHAAQQWLGRAFTTGVHRAFGPFLDFVLRWRYALVVVAFSLFAATVAFALSGRMGFDMFPEVESDFARVDIVLPYGAAVEKTEATVEQLYDAAERVIAEAGHPELVEGIFAEVGHGGSHTAHIQIFLADAEVRDQIMSTEAFVQRWREATGPVMGVDNVTFSSDFGGPGHGAGLTVELSHRDIGVLERASAELAQILTTFPLCKDVNDGFQPGKQQVDFKIRPEGRSLGLTARSVARQLRSAFYGAEVLRQQRGRDEVKVIVRLPEEERVSEENLETLMLRTPTGTEVPLREVADATRGRAYTTIERREGRRIVQVTANVTPRQKAGEVQSGLERDELPALLDKYAGLTYSFGGRQEEMAESMTSLKVGFILAMLAIFGLLAVPFRSYVQPLIIMTSIPFGVIGAIYGHLIMGSSLSVVSMFGVVALAGVVVNDALVLVDAANRRRNAGARDAHDAVLGAAKQRFRPVFLTTVTTFCGLAPMIFETSLQAQMMVPMAISLGFGIVFATLITLLLVPCLYLVVEDVKGAAASVRAFLFPLPLPERPDDASG
ncbi:MAG TPA: efflux RND transporter permease subunit [Candidatus Hydrogenedentes bacterium]|nr:efflux RND transporter permease subunit [Candidatus Hydrogenedentota bacterium]